MKMEVRLYLWRNKQRLQMAHHKMLPLEALLLNFTFVIFILAGTCPSLLYS